MVSSLCDLSSVTWYKKIRPNDRKWTKWSCDSKLSRRVWARGSCVLVLLAKRNLLRRLPILQFYTGVTDLNISQDVYLQFLTSDHVSQYQSYCLYLVHCLRLHLTSYLISSVSRWWFQISSFTTRRALIPMPATKNLRRCDLPQTRGCSEFETGRPASDSHPVPFYCKERRIFLRRAAYSH